MHSLAVFCSCWAIFAIFEASERPPDCEASNPKPLAANPQPANHKKSTVQLGRTSLRPAASELILQGSPHCFPSQAKAYDPIYSIPGIIDTWLLLQLAGILKSQVTEKKLQGTI